MDEPPPNPYRRLLIRAALGLAVTAALVVLCYFYVDRPVAFFVARHKLADTPTDLDWLTEPPPLVQAGRRSSPRSSSPPGPGSRRAVGNASLLVACLTLIVADQCRESLGDVCGRYWPETWHNDNPSLIGTGAYGFHPFETGDDIGSFPSGHAARIAAFLGVFWFAYPRSRSATPAHRRAARHQPHRDELPLRGRRHRRRLPRRNRRRLCRHARRPDGIADA